ncbi:MAG: hypothetical protein ACI4RN_07075 [Oscillospiraceae bacterium]
MKIKIAYQKEEETQVEQLAETIKKKYAVSSEKHSDKHAPFFHIYLTINKA